MANCKKINAPAYELSLTHEEAVALATVLRRVGGDPVSTPRGSIDSISLALSAAGIMSLDPIGIQGSVYF